MIFAVDTNLPPQLATWLRERGHFADHVGTWISLDASDEAIWVKAVREQRVVITKDADFAVWAAARKNGPQVVWLRIGNAKTQPLLAWLDPKWAGIESGLLAGERLVEIYR